MIHLSQNEALHTTLKSIIGVKRYAQVLLNILNKMIVIGMSLYMCLRHEIFKKVLGRTE